MTPRTNNHNDIQKTLIMIDKWLNQLKEQKIPLPSNFDYHIVFISSLKLFQTDHCLTAAKNIWFLYRNISMFPQNIVFDFLDVLLGEMFVQMFAHWSYTVRQIFQHFIAYIMDFIYYRMYGQEYDTE